MTNQQLFDQHILPILPRIKALVARYGHGHGHRDDDLQAVLIALFVNLHHWRRDEPLLPWVDAVVRHRLARLSARRTAPWESELDLDDCTPPTDESTGDTLGHTPADPGSVTALDTYRNQRLVRAVMGLAPHYREMLLRRIDGESYAEIAPTVGLSPEAVAHVVRRAKAMLRTALREAEGSRSERKWSAQEADAP